MSVLLHHIEGGFLYEILDKNSIIDINYEKIYNECDFEHLVE